MQREVAVYNLMMAKRLAYEAAKQGLRRRGIKIRSVTRGEITVLANDYLVKHWDALNAEASERVRVIMAEWDREREHRRLVRNSTNMHRSRSAGNSGEIVCGYPVQNGGGE
jgi:hypothetical protein